MLKADEVTEILSCDFSPDMRRVACGTLGGRLVIRGEACVSNAPPESDSRPGAGTCIDAGAGGRADECPRHRGDLRGLLARRDADRVGHFKSGH
eukprot:3729406-Prymnesium_polylepis.8